MDRRLAAIEHWVGVRPDLGDLDQGIAQVRHDKEAAINRQDFASVALRDKEKQLLAVRAAQDREGTPATVGRMSLARELARVNAELEKLRGILRQHGLNPGDDAA